MVWDLVYNFFISPFLGIFGVIGYVGAIIAVLGLCFIFLRGVAWMCGVRTEWDNDDYTY